jgi:1-deoxy-D-xylulose-5-phosphate reductoisomerase
MHKKKVLIFGSTGSIGLNTLAVIRADRHNFEVMGICANNDVDTLLCQIKEFKPCYVCVANEESARKMVDKIPKNVIFLKGENGLLEFAQIKCDISVMAITGISCLKPLWENIPHAGRIALANKESIVTAGKFLFKRAAKYHTEIIPVDSEINSLFQLFNSEKAFNRVYITASGGALFDCKKSDLSKVTPERVLKHPTWKMGRRITVDSATLVNKAFEVVETHEFFNVPYDKIKVVIHRESTVHAMVERNDHAIFSCMYPPDMQMPIAFSLYYPERISDKKTAMMDRKFSLTFEPINAEKFPGFSAVLSAAERGEAYLAAVNGADESAVQGFLDRKIKFIDIAVIIDKVLNICRAKKITGIDEVLSWDKWGRETAGAYIRGKR